MSNLAQMAGVSLAYRFDGPAHGEVVMLANSLAADMNMWNENVAAFAEKYRVLRYDMRGHGESSTPAGDYTPELLADDVVHLLDHLAIPKVHFVGLSLGGIVGQQLGARHGSRLLSLTLCDTMSKQAAPAAWADRIVAVRTNGMEAVVQSTIDRWFTPSFFERRPDRAVEIKKMILRTRVDGYASCVAAIRQLDQTDLLPRLATRTLVLTGESDQAAPPAVAEAMHERIGGSGLHIVKGAAHLSNVEEPGDFNAAVLSFIGAGN